MKALLKNDQAQAGVGTLIIFIAMVLVAAVAAAVLIQTSGVMQSKSTTTTKEAAAAIGENIAIEAIDGYKTSTGASSIAVLNITIKVAAGGSDVDLSKLLVKVQSQNYNFTGNQTVPPANTFWVYALRQDGAALAPATNGYNTGTTTPMLSSGALARLDINVSALSPAIGAKSSVTLALTPEKGATVNLPITVPALGSGTSVSIYP